MLRKTVRYGLLYACFLSAEANAQEPRLVIPAGHSWGVTQAQFSPDGQLLATAAKDNTIKLWHSATGRLLSTLYGHRSSADKLRFSNKANYLVSNSVGEAVSRIWRIKDGLECIRVKNTVYRGEQIKLSDDEKYAISLAEESIHLWDLPTGKLTDSFRLTASNNYPHTFSQLAISPDSRLIAGYDNRYNRLVIWNRNNKNLPIRIPLDIGYGMLDISFSADNRQLYCISTRKLMVLDVQSGRIIHSSKEYGGDLSEPQISDNGRWFFTGGFDRYYKVVGNDTVDVGDDDERFIYEPTLTDLRTFQSIRLQGEKPAAQLYKLQIDPSARWMLVLTEDSLFAYSIAQNKLRRQSVIHAPQWVGGFLSRVINISASGDYILCNGLGNDPFLFDARGEKKMRLSGAIAYDTAEYYSNDGNYIFTHSGNRQKFSWDIQKGKPSPVYDSTAFAGKEAKPFSLLNYVIYDSADQQWKIGSRDSRIVLKGEKARSLKGASSNNNRYIVTYESGDSLAKVWDSTGTLLYQVRSRYGDFSHPVFSNDDRFVALGRQ